MLSAAGTILNIKRDEKFLFHVLYVREILRRLWLLG